MIRDRENRGARFLAAGGAADVAGGALADRSARAAVLAAGEGFEGADLFAQGLALALLPGTEPGEIAALDDPAAGGEGPLAADGLGADALLACTLAAVVGQLSAGGLALAALEGAANGGLLAGQTLERSLSSACYDGPVPPL